MNIKLKIFFFVTGFINPIFSQNMDNELVESEINLRMFKNHNLKKIIIESFFVDTLMSPKTDRGEIKQYTPHDTILQYNHRFKNKDKGVYQKPPLFYKEDTLGRLLEIYDGKVEPNHYSFKNNLLVQDDQYRYFYDDKKRVVKKMYWGYQSGGMVSELIYKGDSVVEIFSYYVLNDTTVQKTKTFFKKEYQNGVLKSTKTLLWDIKTQTYKTIESSSSFQIIKTENKIRVIITTVTRLFVDLRIYDYYKKE